ncbi:M-phase inducer phosphatase 2 [Bombina bombina]|uniref:M-phase inducer phosphatase 2 n=1 Tax=Bombina bombina TaxID=8345 RepID=UPI00235AA5D4|nr:M-phase inducer phosphatase 2 [Bombina bombina]
MEVEKLLNDFSPCRPECLVSRPTALPGLSSAIADLSRVLSPVTNLALNMNKLTGLGSFSDTPKRKLGMSFHSEVSNLIRTASSDSSDSGLCLDSPSPLDLEDAHETFENAIFETRIAHNDFKLPIRRMRSLPVTFQGGSPVVRKGSVSALDLPKPIERIHTDNKENEVFTFKKPCIRPVCHNRLRTFHGNEFSQRPNSAPALMLFSPGKDDFHVEKESPIRLRKSSLTFSMCINDEEEDDGFMEIMDEDDMKNESGFPSGMENLLTAPFVRNEDTSNTDLVIRSKCRRLFRSPSMPSSVIRPILKRMERPEDEGTPVKTKRLKNLSSSTVEDLPKKEEPKMKLGRSKSLCLSTVEHILDNDQRELIGDSSKTYLLKTVEGKHQDLKYITPEMMSAVLNGTYEDKIERCVIVDCRYPYEYEGGHIRGAVNLPLEHDVEGFLLTNPIVPVNEDKRVIIIFHCEFSSERGPRMCRFVRKQDRMSNEYPNLNYPELYILKGGYKEFFPNYESHCEPQSYRPMHHEDFKEDLKIFRSKSRTWAGERSKRELYSRLKNQ